MEAVEQELFGYGETNATLAVVPMLYEYFFLVHVLVCEFYRYIKMYLIEHAANVSHVLAEHPEMHVIDDTVFSENLEEFCKKVGSGIYHLSFDDYYGKMENLFQLALGIFFRDLFVCAWRIVLYLVCRANVHSA